MKLVAHRTYFQIIVFNMVLKLNINVLKLKREGKKYRIT